MIRNKPCPFCGNDAELFQVTPLSKEFFIGCSSGNCEASGCQFSLDMWNNRPQEDRLKEVIDKLLNSIKISYDENFSRKTVNARFKSVLSEIQKNLGIIK